MFYIVKPFALEKASVLSYVLLLLFYIVQQEAITRLIIQYITLALKSQHDLLVI